MLYWNEVDYLMCDQAMPNEKIFFLNDGVVNFQENPVEDPPNPAGNIKDSKASLLLKSLVPL
jgi:hypothetical protein